MTDEERKLLFCEHLRQRVRRNCMSTNRIADAAGMRSDRLYNLININKPAEPKLCEIIKLCETLKIDPLWLMGWRD